MTYVLIMMMISVNGGGVATAEFDSPEACLQAGEIYMQMGSFQTPKLDYRCVAK